MVVGPNGMHRIQMVIADVSVQRATKRERPLFCPDTNARAVRHN